jgi:hypothetical protein
MRTILTLITAAAFMLHFTLGCCAHHAHAAGGVVCSDSSQAEAHDHECHGHDGHESHGSGDQSPGDSGPECPGQQCDDGQCVFMATGKTVVAKASLVTVLPLVLVEPGLFAADLPHATAAIDSGDLIALPVRTHLFNQVLLI